MNDGHFLEISYIPLESPLVIIILGKPFEINHLGFAFKQLSVARRRLIGYRKSCSGCFEMQPVVVLVQTTGDLQLKQLFFKLHDLPPTYDSSAHYEIMLISKKFNNHTERSNR